MKFTQREIREKIKRKDFKRCNYLRDSNKKLKAFITHEHQASMIFKL